VRRDEGESDVLRTLRKRRFATPFSIAAGVMVSLTIAPTQSTDLELPPADKKSSIAQAGLLLVKLTEHDNISRVKNTVTRYHAL
jgi:hypothetical protein